MTYGRVHPAGQIRNVEGADVSHSAELVRGNFLDGTKGPLIRPFGAPRIKSGAGSSPQGEKGQHGAIGVL
jgi:hypothetical protein